MNTSKIFCYPQQVSFKNNISPDLNYKEDYDTVEIDNTLVRLSLDNYHAYYLTFKGMKDI